jgi:hypothetical protein
LRSIIRQNLLISSQLPSGSRHSGIFAARFDLGNQQLLPCTDAIAVSLSIPLWIFKRGLFQSPEFVVSPVTFRYHPNNACLAAGISRRSMVAGTVQCSVQALIFPILALSNISRNFTLEHKPHSCNIRIPLQ